MRTYLSDSAVVFHYEEALYQVYAPLALFAKPHLVTLYAVVRQRSKGDVTDLVPAIVCSSLHCALAAAQCIVIGPLCLSVGGWVCVIVGRSVTTITRDCVHRSSPNWVCR